jgi:hypothetical protein
MPTVKRTLLAAGVAVLLSMMATPQKGYRYHWHCWLVYEQCQYQPFFRTNAADWDWKQFQMQTVFAAVAATVIVNLFPRRPSK